MDKMVDFMLCVCYPLMHKKLKNFIFFLLTFLLLFLILPARDLLWRSQLLNVAGSTERLAAWAPPAVSAALSGGRYRPAGWARPRPVQWEELPLWKPSAHRPEAFPRCVAQRSCSERSGGWEHTHFCAYSFLRFILFLCVDTDSKCFHATLCCLGRSFFFCLFFNKNF